MFISRNARRMGNALNEELASVGCVPQDVILVGQDPVMLDVRYIVVARDINPRHPEAPFRVFNAYDWSVHPTKANRERGVILSTKAYWRPYNEARVIATQEYNDLLSGYAWVYPGTKDLIPGCNGYGRRLVV